MGQRHRSNIAHSSNVNDTATDHIGSFARIETTCEHHTHLANVGTGGETVYLVHELLSGNIEHIVDTWNTPVHNVAFFNTSKAVSLRENPEHVRHAVPYRAPALPLP
eukprot:8728111-Pyramimonas_sp.AAC.2